MTENFLFSSPTPLHGNKNADLIIGGGKYRESQNGPDKFVLACISEHSLAPRLIGADFFPHGFATIAHNKNLLYGFEKIGPGAALFDIQTLQLVQKILPVKNRLFYGHGVCSIDFSLLYTTETSADGEGAIGIRRTSDLAYVGDFPTFGSHPHDCHLVNNGNVMVVSNGGGTKDSGNRASICYIDIKSERLLHRIEMTDDRFNAGHIFPLHGNQSILVSAPRRGLGDSYPGAVSIQRDGDELVPLSHPVSITSNITGEALSVLAIPSKNLFMVTHPIPGMVTLWNLNSGSFITQIHLPKPRGLALSGNGAEVWISFGESAELAKLDLLSLKTTSRKVNTFLTGSHLYKI